MEVAEDYLKVAKQLLHQDMHDRSVISRAYYGMYHAVRAAVYIRMRLDVPEHKKLIKKFEKVLIKEYNDSTFGSYFEKWRSNRNWYEYNPLVQPSRGLCVQAINDCKNIIEICKKLMEVS
ncbi:MAG: HEPN domain-containing protein [Methanosarcinales archaeon]